MATWHKSMASIDVRRGVSKKEEEDGCRLPVLWVGHPRNGLKVVSGLACLQGVEGLGMAGPGETLESPSPPLPIHYNGKRWPWTP
jgi:hypothetical protein